MTADQLFLCQCWAQHCGFLKGTLKSVEDMCRIKTWRGRQSSFQKGFSASVRTVTGIQGELWSLERPASRSCALTRTIATVSLAGRSLGAAAAAHLWCQGSRNFGDAQSLEISLPGLWKGGSSSDLSRQGKQTTQHSGFDYVFNSGNNPPSSLCRTVLRKQSFKSHFYQSSI